MISTKTKQIFGTENSRELATIYASGYALNTTTKPAPLSKKIIEKWYTDVVNELEAADHVAMMQRDQEQDQMIRDAQVKFMDAKRAEMAKMMHKVDNQTAKFIQEQHTANARFIKKIYGERIK